MAHAGIRLGGCVGGNTACTPVADATDWRLKVAERIREPRWRDYVLAFDGEAADLLASASSGDRRVVFIYGDGFDPRTLMGLEALIENGVSPSVLQVGMQTGSGAGPASALAAANRERFSHLVGQCGLSVHRLGHIAGSDRLSRGLNLSRTLLEEKHVTTDDVVVVDISALPSTLFFPLIGTQLELRRRGPSEGELLVVAAENPILDARVTHEGTEDPGPISGFARRLMDAPDVITVWVPVLGEHQTGELERISAFLEPDEICPVLPFPARDPRRADDLILEHRELLFDTFDVTPRNLLYADESNPFDVYRSLLGLTDRYGRTLGPLGEPVIAVSAHTSKLLSVGICLAAWEADLPVVNAGPSNYGLEERPDPEWVAETSQLACLWLDGTPFKAG